MRSMLRICYMCGEPGGQYTGQIQKNRMAEAVRSGLTVKSPDSPYIHDACDRKLLGWVDWKRKQDIEETADIGDSNG